MINKFLLITGITTLVIFSLVSCKNDSEPQPTQLSTEQLENASSNQTPAQAEAANGFEPASRVVLTIPTIRALGGNFLNNAYLLGLYKIGNSTPDGLWFNGDKVGAGREYNNYNSPTFTFKNALFELMPNESVTPIPHAASETVVTAKTYDNTRGRSVMSVSVPFTERSGHYVTIRVTNPAQFKLGTGLITKVTMGGYSGNYRAFSVTPPSPTLSNYRPLAKGWPITVAPGRKLSVIITEIVRRTEYRYQIFHHLTGHISTNFGSRVNGHYFWAQPAWKLIKDVPDSWRSERGTINVYTTTYRLDYKYL